MEYCQECQAYLQGLADALLLAKTATKNGYTTKRVETYIQAKMKHYREGK
jgi:hypothetical protein